MKKDDAKKGDVFSYESKKLAAASTALNVFLAAIKFFLYFMTGSSALLAETVHSLTDTIGSLLVVGGLYLSEKKSEQFPWGLYKVENVVSVLLAGMIFLSAYEIAKAIYHPSPREMTNLDMALVILFLMAIPLIFFSGHEARRAKAMNFPSLMADAKHWRADIAPLAVVAAGIAGARLSYPVMDRIAAFVILLLVIRAGYEILKDSIKSLLDASVERTVLDNIEAVIKEFSPVKEITALHARNSGRFIFVNLDLRLSLKRLKVAHEIGDDIAQKIRRRIPFVERVIVHYEPEKKEFLRFAAPLASREGAISEHFGKAPFVALWDKRVTDGATVSRKILENPFSGVEKGKGIRLAEFLATMKVDVLYTREPFEGKGPEYVFADAGIEIRKTSAQNLKNLMEHEPAEMHSMELLS